MNPKVFFAGQICGVEGYIESIATGLLAGINASRLAQGQEPVSPPRSTACGSLTHYISFAGSADFQPANITFGLLPGISPEMKKSMKDRKERHQWQIQESLRRMDEWIRSVGADL